MNRLILVATLLLSMTSVVAQEAGNVSFAVGEVSADRDPPVALAKDDSVLADDTIVTGDSARAQLLMIDGAKIAVRPNSRLQIEEYNYAPATPSATISATDDTSVMRLVKGGFRTITGAIGDDSPENYEVRTAVGVLGIRGTDYALLFCLGDCDWAPGVAAGVPVPDGLYIMVTDGSIEFRNSNTNIVVNSGEFVFIPLDTQRPQRLDTTPPVFINPDDFRLDAVTGQTSSSAVGQGALALTGFDNKLGDRRKPQSGQQPSSTPEPGEDESRESPTQPIQGRDEDGNDFDLTPAVPPEPTQPIQQNRSISWTSGPLGQGLPGFSGVFDNVEGQYADDASGDLAAFENLYPAGQAGVEQATFEIGTATVAESASDPLTFMRWGRWSAGTVSITTAGGTDFSQDLGNQSLHWISSPEWEDAPVMPMSGTATYTLIGSTTPTDSNGNTGVLGDATFQADFTNMLVNSTLVIDISGLNWTATGTGTIGAQAMLPAHLFQGTYGTVTITDANGNQFDGQGQFSGFFSTPGTTSDPSLPGGAGLTYSLSDQQSSETVSGAAAFGNP